MALEKHDAHVATDAPEDTRRLERSSVLAVCSVDCRVGGRVALSVLDSTLLAWLCNKRLWYQCIYRKS